MEAPFKAPGIVAIHKTTTADLDQIHSGSPTLVQTEWRPVWKLYISSRMAKYIVLSSVRRHQDWAEGPRGWVHMALGSPASVQQATFPSRGQVALAGSLGEVWLQNVPESWWAARSFQWKQTFISSNLVMESMESRSLSRKAIGPENPPKIWMLLGKKRQLVRRRSCLALGWVQSKGERGTQCIGSLQR